jgi:multiple sugar transport system permease protein
MTISHVKGDEGRKRLEPDPRQTGWTRRLHLPPLTERRREAIIAYILISPWVIGFVAFLLGPMLWSLGLSFFESDMLTSKFVGLRNYTTLFSTDTTRSLFWTSLYNTTYYVLLSIPLTMAAGFMLAMLLNQKIRGVGFYRIIYYLPSVIPAIAVSLLWLWLFNPEFGLLNWFLSWFGIDKLRWLTDPQLAKPSLVLMSIWGAGGNMLIFLAGLQGIPTELYEAATIDGTSPAGRFRHITLPMVSPTLFFVLVTNIIGAFQAFTSVYVMTGGGPANSTLMYVLYLYNLAFRQYRMGLGSALAWIYFIIILLMTIIIFRSSAAWVYYETEIGGRRK